MKINLTHFAIATALSRNPGKVYITFAERPGLYLVRYNSGIVTLGYKFFSIHRSPKMVSQVLCKYTSRTDLQAAMRAAVYAQKATRTDIDADVLKLNSMAIFKGHMNHVEPMPLFEHKVEEQPTNVSPENTLLHQFKATLELNAHFNSATGHYDEGWSDQRVSDETGCPVDYVTILRDATLGKIRPKEDPAITKMQQHLDVLTEMLAEAQKALNDLKAERKS